MISGVAISKWNKFFSFSLFFHRIKWRINTLWYQEETQGHFGTCHNLFGFVLLSNRVLPLYPRYLYCLLLFIARVYVFWYQDIRLKQNKVLSMHAATYKTPLGMIITGNINWTLHNWSFAVLYLFIEAICHYDTFQKHLPPTEQMTDFSTEKIRISITKKLRFAHARSDDYLVPCH